MFLPKVGSDACLVLDCEVNSMGNRFSMIQTFTLEELAEATKTRIVIIRGVTSQNVIILGYCSTVEPTGFTASNVLDGNTVTIVFNQENGKWVGTLD